MPELGLQRSEQIWKRAGPACGTILERKECSTFISDVKTLDLSRREKDSQQLLLTETSLQERGYLPSSCGVPQDEGSKGWPSIIESGGFPECLNRRCCLLNVSFTKFRRAWYCWRHTNLSITKVSSAKREGIIAYQELQATSPKAANPKFVAVGILPGRFN